MPTVEKPVLSKYRERMDKAVAALKEDFATLRTGRASSGLLDQIVIEAYGSRMPINQVGAVSWVEPALVQHGAPVFEHLRDVGVKSPMNCISSGVISSVPDARSAAAFPATSR